MPKRKLSLSRSIGASLRWPAGVALTSWRYMWRTTPYQRVEEAGTWPEDAPPPLPPGALDDQVQQVGDGSGVLFHRRYRTRIRDAKLSPEELMARLQASPDHAAPTEFATFKKVVGDEVGVRPRRVRGSHAWPVGRAGSGRRGHPALLSPADARRTPGGRSDRVSGARRVRAVEFEIESWARAGDRLSDLLYDRLRMSETRAHVPRFLERVIGSSGGTRDGRLEIHTAAWSSRRAA